MKVRIHGSARQELRDATRWYLDHDVGTAVRFLDALDEAIFRIGEDPDSLPFEHKHFRWIRIRHFPYRLIFEHPTPLEVMIIALVHTRRRPGYRLGRK